MDKIATACPNCGREVQGSEAACPGCGKPLPNVGLPVGSGGAAGNENYLALVRADVYRLRRQWQLAEVECSEVLRRDPDNPDAYSVMGDIYRDQGLLRDAIEWYRMALDRNPASIADRRKLEAIIDQVFPRRPPRKAGGLASLVRKRLSPESPAQRAQPFSLTATVALALAVVFAIAVSAALLIRESPVPAGNLASNTASGGFASGSEEAAAGPRAAAGGQTGQARVHEEWTESLPSLEAELLAHLQSQAEATDVNCQVTSVELDPLAGAASVRFTMPRLWSPAESRRNIARVASALAAGTFAFDPGIGAVRARCQLRGAGAEGEVVMLAETDRETLTRAREAGSGDEQGFVSMWWRQEFRPASGFQSSGPEG